MELYYSYGAEARKCHSATTPGAERDVRGAAAEARGRSPPPGPTVGKLLPAGRRAPALRRNNGRMSRSGQPHGHRRQESALPGLPRMRILPLMGSGPRLARWFERCVVPRLGGTRAAVFGDGQLRRIDDDCSGENAFREREKGA